MKKRLTICFMAVFLISSIGYAQVTTSSIHGNVYDENNQPLPDASVVAVHTPTGTKYGSTTNFDGVVNLRNLRVGGPYTISISFVGFETMEYTNINLTLGDSFDFKAVLQPDSQQLGEVVLKTKTDKTFSKERTGAATSVSREELTTLPTISRSASDFLVWTLLLVVDRLGVEMINTITIL